VLGAFSNHDNIESAGRADRQNGVLLTAIEKIARDLKVDPNQSAEVLSEKIMQKLNEQRRASRLTNHFYQEDRDMAVVSGWIVNEPLNEIKFEILTSQAIFDFGKEVEFQKARLKCDPQSPSTSAIMGASMNLSYYRVTCHYLGLIQ